MRVHLTRIDEMVMPRDRPTAVRTVPEWYEGHHPVWFDWLEVV